MRKMQLKRKQIWQLKCWPWNVHTSPALLENTCHKTKTNCKLGQMKLKVGIEKIDHLWKNKAKGW